MQFFRSLGLTTSTLRTSRLGDLQQRIAYFVAHTSPIRGWQGELHSHTSPSTHTSMFYKQRLRKLLIKTSHLLQRSQYAAPWLLLKEATISNNFSQRKEKIPERLLHQSPKFLIQMFASEDACENLFGIPYFSDYKYLNSLGSFQDVRMEQRMN